jgi:hypothetical protein
MASLIESMLQAAHDSSSSQFRSCSTPASWTVSSFRPRSCGRATVRKNQSGLNSVFTRLRTFKFFPKSASKWYFIVGVEFNRLRCYKFVASERMKAKGASKGVVELKMAPNHLMVKFGFWSDDVMDWMAAWMLTVWLSKRVQICASLTDLALCEPSVVLSEPVEVWSFVSSLSARVRASSRVKLLIYSASSFLSSIVRKNRSIPYPSFTSKLRWRSSLASLPRSRSPASTSSSH